MKKVWGLLFITTVTYAADSTSARDWSREAGQLYNQARYTEAEPLFRKALEGWSKLGPEAALDYAIDLRNLGALLRARGRYEEAEPMLLDAASRLEATAGPSLETSRAFYNLASLYRTRGDMAKAESFALRATAMAEKDTAASPAERLSPRMVLASVYIEQRRFADAEAILEPAMDTADGPLAVVIFDNRAIIAIARGEYERAEGFARQALYFAHLALPANHPAVAASWSNLAQACRFQSHYLEAEEAYRQAIAIWEKSVGPNHPDVAKGLLNLAGFYHERGREAGAEQLYRRAAAILEQAFGKDDPRTLSARNELAEVLRAERRYSESTRLERSTLSAMEAALPADDPRLVRAQSNFARLIEESRNAEARCRKASCQTQSPQ